MLFLLQTHNICLHYRRTSEAFTSNTLSFEAYLYKMRAFLSPC